MSIESIRIEVQRPLEPLMGLFFDNRRKLLTTAEAYCRLDNLEELHAIGHNFKGTCGSYGFHELSRLGSELQNAGDMDNARELVRQMREHLDKIEVVYI